MTHIPSLIFYDANVKSVTIGNNVTEIGALAFATSLTSVTFTDPRSWCYHEVIGVYTIPETVLDDPATAAEYLKYHNIFGWSKSLNE